MNMRIRTRPDVWSSASPPRHHRQDRLELHNIDVDEAFAARHRCGNLHLPSGRVCLLPERHRGGCQFTARPAP